MESKYASDGREVKDGDLDNAHYTLTVETLQKMSGNTWYSKFLGAGTDVTSHKFKIIDFRGHAFKLKSLENISYIGDGDPKARDVVQEFLLDGNRLTTLVHIAVDNGVLGVFDKVNSIMARNNLIQYMCATPQQPMCNEWPVKMLFLLELDLSFNRLET